MSTKRDRRRSRLQQKRIKLAIRIRNLEEKLCDPTLGIGDPMYWYPALSGLSMRDLKFVESYKGSLGTFWALISFREAFTIVLTERVLGLQDNP